MKIAEKLKTSFIIAAFFVLLLQVGVMNILPGTLSLLLSYFDDALECVLIVALLVQMLRGRLHFEKIEYVMLVSTVLFEVAGLASNLVSGIQVPFYYLSDALVCCRFIVFYFGCRVFLPGTEEKNIILKYFSIGCKIITTVFALLIVHDLLFEPFFQRNQFRFFMKSFQLFYTDPSPLGACAFLCAATIMFAGISSPKSKVSDSIFIFLAIAVSMTCLRSKTMAACVFLIILYVIFCLLEMKLSYVWDAIVGAVFAIGAIVFAMPRIIQFYGTDKIEKGSTRAVMTADSVKIATERFPFGTGFGTFGSSAAFKSTSKLYLELDYQNRLLDIYDKANWKVNTCDIFWPTVIAQTGWIGTAAFLCIVVCFIMLTLQEQKRNPYTFVTMASVLAYLLIASSGEASFFTPMMNSGFVLFAMASDYFKKKKS